MAMTKAERAEMERLQQELAEAKALRFLGIPEPERSQLPVGKEPYRNGWDFHSSREGAVFEAWTESNAHGRDHRIDDGQWGNRPMGGSQNANPLYATKLDALIGLRLMKERDCAKLLANIDRMIEKERAVILVVTVTKHVPSRPADRG